MTLVRDLIGTARHLAEDGASDADFRRSISTAYYAVFHAVVGAAVDVHLIEPSVRSNVRRMMEHRSMASVAKTYSNAPIDPRASVPNELKNYGQLVMPGKSVILVATLFVQLQAMRHAADYDTTKTFSRTEARDAVQMCAKTVGLVNGMTRRRDPDLLHMLACMMFGKPRP